MLAVASNPTVYVCLCTAECDEQDAKAIFMAKGSFCCHISHDFLGTWLSLLCSIWGRFFERDIPVSQHTERPAPQLFHLLLQHVSDAPPQRQGFLVSATGLCQF